MPTYLDIHDLPGAVTAEDLAKAHNADQQVSEQVRGRIPQVLGEPEERQTLLHVHRAQRRGSGRRASGGAWHDCAQDY